MSTPITYNGCNSATDPATPDDGTENACLEPIGIYAPVSPSEFLAPAHRSPSPAVVRPIKVPTRKKRQNPARAAAQRVSMLDMQNRLDTATCIVNDLNALLARHQRAINQLGVSYTTIYHGTFSKAMRDVAEIFPDDPIKAQHVLGVISNLLYTMLEPIHRALAEFEVPYNPLELFRPPLPTDKTKTTNT